MFAWDVQYDDQDRLLNFFWVDGRSRIDYECFGDVLIFYTSYRLNKYNFVCAPFVGVNNHWQNVLFGLAFLLEEAWDEMIKKGNLHNHEWLQDLYKIRRKWSTAFNKDSFCIGILSTQRSEYANNVCHGISKPTSSLTDCFLGLEKILMNWRRNEQDEDYKCSQSEIVPVIKNSSILKQAARFYSRKIYSIFEEEFIKAVGEMSIDFVSTDSSKYIVNYIEKKNQNHPWVVYFDATEGNIQCSCKKYETMGLLCSHCLRVFKQLDMAKFPEKYLLLRWSARARQVFYSGYLLNSQRSNNFQSGRGFIFRNQVSRFAYQMST
ncbi:Protein FAR1-RELATED SEQUENCE 9 [Dendrobium catenatum]|uniref:Protein FAR1-RELATED SEQUENCE n=1 Tax=Dendrobium catenatum TaxID=906689 RepID=A0A2I0VBB9_9ASPA|nr:Protein FAR1-RELATED SEQUENCE 9 [Dendrobium catenatum]